MKSSERIRRNVGHLAFGLLGAVLLWMAWRSLQYENWRSAVLIVALSLSLLWGVLASRYEPDWRAEMPPPSSLVQQARQFGRSTPFRAVAAHDKLPGLPRRP